MKQKIKREKEEDWAKAKNFIPKKDEVIIYDCDDGSVKIKVGDGITKVNDLPFTNNNMSISLRDGLLVMKGEN